MEALREPPLVVMNWKVLLLRMMAQPLSRGTTHRDVVVLFWVWFRTLRALACVSTIASKYSRSTANRTEQVVLVAFPFDNHKVAHINCMWLFRDT